MKKFIGVFMAASLAFSDVYASENEGFITMLRLAKVAGVCGAYQRLLDFHEATKMPGGDELLLRFFNAEAARVGSTPTQVMTDCTTAVWQFSDLMRALESDK